MTIGPVYFHTNRSCRLAPAHGGLKNHDLWFGAANRHGGFCNATPRPQRGRSPSPREVFDRATVPTSPPLWIPAFAGMTNGGPD